ncbi:MAG: GDP-mannose 4,6-dehydratase [Anaerolineales bacterium]|nr:GDP-mannose 4,6-dehydratase [Anaerolineales bacterium]
MGNYLLTGAAGFVAGRVAERLLADGHTVHGLDNLNDAYDVRMKEHRLARLNALPGFSFRQMDIGDPSTLEALETGDQRFDGIINLAARAGVRSSLENPWEYFRTNVTGTLNMLEFCRRRDIPKFVLASSSSVYGSDAPLPTPESYDSSHPLQPYAASKKSAEVLCHSYHYLYGTDVTIFRYFTVYGPSGRPDMSVFRFTQWISEERPVVVFGDGEQSRGYTFIDDIARGTVAGLRPLGFEIINLGGHEIIKINALITALEERIGKAAQIERRDRHPADMQTNWADVSRAQTLLGWQPQVSLDAGLDETVNWYLAQREWASQVNTA